ncbi:MAG: SPOR domain-containing protein [Candidatus Eisenbacteria bacterium]|nr:SPOR domain-containing protein [Candidatus Eisenbacteria bacterium]
MKRIVTGILPALALGTLVGCAGLQSRGSGEVPKDVQDVDTWVVNREEAAAAVAAADTTAPAADAETAAEPVISGIPETETAAAPPLETEAPENPAVPENAPPEIARETPREEIAAVPLPETKMPDTAKPEPAPAASMQTRYSPGFRVQVLASRSPEDARGFAEDLRSSITETVYVEYLAPYYKVRIGDCSTREEANRLLKRIREAGYDKAWIAETLVVQGAVKRP